MTAQALYALHDCDPFLRELLGSVPCSTEEARELNLDGYGIFWVPNSFTGRRVKVNLERINYWYAELDEGTKAEQRERIKNAPLLPSLVVETKKGYHCYWKVKGEASPANWKRIVRDGLVPALRADPKVTDVLRLLRVPGYLHQKNPLAPFVVKLVWDTKLAWTEEQMLRAFPSTKHDHAPKTTKPRITPEDPEWETLPFWGRVAHLDGREALLRLSGHEAMNGEHFRLEEMPNGNANVWRLDPQGTEYSTGSFIDSEGRFGCVKDGSSIGAWLRWYGNSWTYIAEVLKAEFPELSNKEQTNEEEDEVQA